MSDLDGPRFAEDVLRDEDDFTHYFNATARLSAENKDLRSTVERLTKELADLREAGRAWLDEGKARLCKVCLGISPSWDGHEWVPTPCRGALRETFVAALSQTAPKGSEHE